MKGNDEKIVYLNGRFVPESEAKIPWRSTGFFLGTCVFDTMRTVQKKRVFRLEDHIERLFNSLRYIEEDPGISPKEMGQIVMEVAERNAHLLADDEELDISAYVTAGVVSGNMYEWERGPPEVIVGGAVFSLSTYAKYYKEGTHVVVASTRIPPPQCLDPKIKNTNRLFSHIAELETAKVDLEPHFTLMLDIYGNIAEFTAANLFVVSKGTLITPPTRNVLGGISRKVVLELAEELDIPAFERDIQLYHLYNANEAFQTASSYCIFPISCVNKRQLWKDIPGPITKSLLDAYSEELGVDILGEAESLYNQSNFARSYPEIE